MRRFFSAPAFLILLAAWCGPAEAARQFTVTQTNPVPASAVFVMGTTNPVTFRIANTCSGSNSTETITTVRFRANGTYTTFSNTTAAPAGWARTSFSTTSITFQANTTSDRIPSGSYKDFTLQLICAASTQDRTDSLRDVRCTFITTRNKTSNVTNRNEGSWAIRSLTMTLTPSTLTVATGGTFTLTMSVTNKSTSSLTGVTSVPKPPALNVVSGSPPPNPSTSSNPANLSLAAGATGNMVWTYSAGTRAGTVTFTAYARDSAGTRTSVSVTTPVITISAGNLTATLANNNPCVFSGDTATFVMTVTVTGTLTNIVPSALSKYGSAAIGAFTGPSPASIPSLTNGSGTFTWTAPVTGSVGDTFYVTGYATATGGIQSTVATSNTQTVKGYTIGFDPDTTNADSTIEDITWTIDNSGCDNINQVAIGVPGGWTVSTDTYAVVTNTVGSEVDTWTCAGSTFTSPVSIDRIPVGNSGSFSILFFATPLATGNYTFNITITDDASPTPVIKTILATITVNPYNTGGLNATPNELWQEVVK